MTTPTYFDPRVFLETLTNHPGVYQMFDEQGKIIYIGKASNLKKRVSSYFQRHLTDPKTIALVEQIANIQVIVTESDTEALLLESHLIKKHHPPYNILLRDDKSYPYLFLSAHQDFPRLDFHRGAQREKGHYFGPFPSASAVRDSLNILQKLFKLRQCSDNFFKMRSRPCLQYQIKRCTAPCVGYIDKASYLENVRRAELFLEGKNQQIINELVGSMEKASHNLDYEKAALYRDQVASLRKIQEKQHVYGTHGDVDVFAEVKHQQTICVNILYIRSGRIIGNKAFFPKVAMNFTEEEVINGFLPQYYFSTHRQREIPRTIVLGLKIADQALIEQALSEQLGKAVTILSRVQKDKAKWLQMAKRNGQQALASHVAARSTFSGRLDALQEALSLENIPERLVCFDISHTSGEATIASCVVFNAEGPDKSAYRRFNIRDITPGDDYAAMHQALFRHFKRVKEGGEKLPDILFIDGGKGQLHKAEQVLEELQVSGIMLVGIAKGVERKPGLETLYISKRPQALHLKSDDEALHLIQQIRDEAHRFAITGHRQKRSLARKISTLEQIPGIGAKRRKALLLRFGGIQELKRANVDEIAKTEGISYALAERIYDAIH